MPDPDDQHYQDVVEHLVQHSVVGHTNPPDVLGAPQLLRPGWMGVAPEGVYCTSQAAAHGDGRLLERPSRAGQKLDAVHDARPLQIQAGLEFLPADVFTVGRVGERGTHVVEVPRILERFEQLQVFDRHDRGDAASMARENHPFVPKGDPIDRR